MPHVSSGRGAARVQWGRRHLYFRTIRWKILKYIYLP